MSTTLPPRSQAANASIFDSYALGAGVFDELFAAPGTAREHWRTFVRLVELIGAQELARRWEQAQAQVRENGMTYNAYGDPDDALRPWDLDALPLIISADEWNTLSRGLIQRARLFDLVLADLYGPQNLLQQKLLPPRWLFAHPGFLRAFAGQRPPGGRFLHLCAVDLARAPDGCWWVVGDRTDAPLGAGYALENRIVVSRMLPRVIHDCRVERLAPFFISLQEMLRQLAPRHRENPHIVLLSQGPGSPNYFEDAYLARYLGYPLVEAGDLAVRDDRVALKTLGKLQPIDVIFRRLSDRYCDPLELGGDPTLGTPGLQHVARSGNVAIANALGSSLVESPALMPFLPALAQALLGEPLALPSVATWWCGGKTEREHVLAHLDSLAIRSAYRVGRQEPTPAEQLQLKSTDELIAEIRSRPEQFVGQEQIRRSSAPVWRKRMVQPFDVTLRVFLVATEDSYTALPGGLVRVSSTSGRLDLSILAGEGSKDAWVLADGPVQPVSLLSPPDKPVALRRSGAEVPSRVADNVFWLGRRTERAEGLCRLLRPILTRFTSEAEAGVVPELGTLLHCMAASGLIEPGFVVEGVRDQLPSAETAMPAAILDKEQEGSLRTTFAAAYRNAWQVRDRLSMDSWRIVHRLEQQMGALAKRRVVGLPDLLELVNQMIIDLAAFGGLVDESMTRTQVWRFLELGRRLERSMQTINLVRSALAVAPAEDRPVLDALLEVADSKMTYRSRYLGSLQMAPVLDLLLTDETNPRSLVYQLAQLAEHVNNLPRDANQPLRSDEEQLAMKAVNCIRLIDAEDLRERRRADRPTKVQQTLRQLGDDLPKLAETISHKFLVHGGAPRQLTGTSATGDAS